LPPNPNAFTGPNPGTRFDFAPGFDCTMAQTVTELSICQSPVLATLDQELNSLYQYRRNQGTSASQKFIKEFQSLWLQVRDMCGADVYCIEQRYHEQIDFLWNYSG